MVCERYLDLKTTTAVGVSTCPILDYDIGVQG